MLSVSGLCTDRYASKTDANRNIVSKQPRTTCWCSIEMFHENHPEIPTFFIELPYFDFLTVVKMKILVKLMKHFHLIPEAY